MDRVLLNSKFFEADGVETIGVIVNRVPEKEMKSFTAFAERQFGRMELPLFGVIPEEPRLKSFHFLQIPEFLRGTMLLGRQNAERIVFDSRRAIGVAIRRRGQHEIVRARKEVVLAASAFNSPQLLMLSGIGPAEHLRAQGIEVLINRPGVGSNLQDHMDVILN